MQPCGRDTVSVPRGQRPAAAGASAHSSDNATATHASATLAVTDRVRRGARPVTRDTGACPDALHLFPRPVIHVPSGARLSRVAGRAPGGTQAVIQAGGATAIAVHERSVVTRRRFGPAARRLRAETERQIHARSSVPSAASTARVVVRRRERDGHRAAQWCRVVCAGRPRTMRTLLSSGRIVPAEGCWPMTTRIRCLRRAERAV
jgi:hypothetical protein